MMALSLIPSMKCSVEVNKSVQLRVLVAEPGYKQWIAFSSFFRKHSPFGGQLFKRASLPLSQAPEIS